VEVDGIRGDDGPGVGAHVVDLAHGGVRVRGGAAHGDPHSGSGQVVGVEALAEGDPITAHAGGLGDSLEVDDVGAPSDVHRPGRPAVRGGPLVQVGGGGG